MSGRGVGARIEFELGCRQARIRGCQPFLAALRHNKNATAWRPAAGVRQAEVARQLEVSAQAISVWHARWQQDGNQALRSKGPSGPAPRLSDQQLATVEQALLEGATANGFIGELGPWSGSRW